MLLLANDFFLRNALKTFEYSKFIRDTHRIEVQIGVDLLIIGNKWLIITGLIYKSKKKKNLLSEHRAKY